MANHSYSISVVYPAYNEEENFEATIARSIEALNNQFEKFEIIIVNDASTDSTGALADRVAQADSRVRVLHNQVNLRAGASLVKGMEAAQYELVTHNGMDYPFDLADLSKMLPLFESYDVVAASRLARPGYTPYRHFLSFMNLLMLHTLFSLKLHDYNFTQVYRREVLQAVNLRARSTAFVTPELMIRAHKLGFKVTEIDIEYLPRLAGEARSGNIRVIIHTLKDMLSFWWELNFASTKKPQ